VALLKEIGEGLADIHGQQDQRTLLDLSTHLEWLDDFGGNAALRKEVKDSFRKLRETLRQLESVELNEQERLRRIDVLQFQIDEIRHVDPQPDEREALENERNVLSNREKILTLATEAHSVLYESESSILREIGHVERLLEELESFDKSWNPHREALQETRYKLEDVAFAARDYASGGEFSPERLEQVHDRLYSLDKLTKKYGSSILEYLERCTKELEELLSSAESAARLSDQLQQEMVKYRTLADALSGKRHSDAARLASDIRKEFAALAMERMEMRVHFHPNQEEKARGHVPTFYGLDGIDHVEFLIAPNKGEEMRPLAKIASGGELSRLMLSIKSLCGSEEVDRTLVFDEVDTGIGGRVAEAVGKRLRSIAEANQVLCVTHLPQIAAFARNHFSVTKEVLGGRTETAVKRLDHLERVEELSRMLGGEMITPTVRRHAQELLEHSKEPKQKKETQPH